MKQLKEYFKFEILNTSKLVLNSYNPFSFIIIKYALNVSMMYVVDSYKKLKVIDKFGF